MSVSEVAAWVKSERARLGWSAAELAARARRHAEAAGSETGLSQQSISAFENGTAKRMPAWFQHVRAAFDEANAGTSLAAPENAKTLQFVTMRVALPSEAALTRMFEGLLLPLDHELSRAELARILAQRLPIGLAQVQALLPQLDQDGARGADEAPPAPATGGRESPRAPRT
ncbi:hypothetical protein OMP43_03805 [Sphingomonas sp. CBMAI 2297]|uniref:hypothetical protein n=1 Tax=Sphingomonas sp. CBMAI 2297 TaxID=2991720 RepID=UPI002458BEFA|nr:hypothetical protein [Sphingomonas sp. CBMAI 2297]MDH4743140.1 hypothetical protein [Sphingomonas sp. CBMAI 2297]